MMQDHAGSKLAAGIEDSLAERFGERLQVDPALAGLDELARIAGHRVHRDFSIGWSNPALLRLLCAWRLVGPLESDLQQADILVVEDAHLRREIIALMPRHAMARARAGIAGCPGQTGHRTPQLARQRGKPFPNNHFDLLFNATVDGTIALTTFMRAAAAVGLGCCRSAPFGTRLTASARCWGCRSA